jgi:hypothetical protein
MIDLNVLLIIFWGENRYHRPFERRQAITEPIGSSRFSLAAIINQRAAPECTR